MTQRSSVSPVAPPLSPLTPKPSALKRGQLFALIALIASSALLSVGHLLATPVATTTAVNFINAPDEAAHLEYVRAVAVGHRLPTQGDATYPTYEWHQPPLYYALAAVVYPLGPHAIRMLSILLGSITLLCIFTLARRLAPNEPHAALLAVGLAGLTPMRQAITAAAGNDALVEALFAAFAVVLVAVLLDGFGRRRAVLLGALLGLAVLAKATALVLAPLPILATLVLWRQGEQAATAALSLCLCLATALVFASPWLVRNVNLYHEIIPMKAFTEEFRGTMKATDWIGQPLAVDVVSGDLVQGPPMNRTGYVLLVSNWAFRTYWAAYTPRNLASQGVPRFLPPIAYALPAIMALLAVGGLVRLHFQRKQFFTEPQIVCIGLMFVLLVLVSAAYAGFAWTYFQAQGRYLYPATIALAALAALGIRAALPERWRTAATVGLLTAMALSSLLLLFGAVVPAYSGF